MSKRFTDTRKHRKRWYRELPLKLKVAWDILCNECDHAGVWDIDWPTLSHFVGQNVTEQECKDSFGDKVMFLPDDKLFLPGFVEFQYGHNFESLRNLPKHNRVQKSVIERLIKVGVYEPLPNTSLTLCETFSDSVSGSLTRKDKDKDKNKEKDKNKNSGIPDDVCKEWEATLTHYNRTPNWSRDESPLYRLYMRVKDWGRVKNALAGFRYEQKSDGYNPACHVTLSRIQDPKKFEHLEALGETRPDNDEKKSAIFTTELK